MERKLDNFVIVPRQIMADLLSGRLTRPEYDTYLFCRLNATPYGIYRTDLRILNENLFKGTNTENYVNKILLSLKKKRYLYYQKRPGRRGLFDIHFGDWILPNKKIKDLKPLFEGELVRSDRPQEAPKKVESIQRSGVDSQRSKEIRGEITQMLSKITSGEQIRGYYNDTDKEKDTDINPFNSI